MSDKERQIVYRDVDDLMEHPQNPELFGKIEDDLKDPSKKEIWEEFKKSIEERGILHPLIITSKDVVISGWRRRCAAKELGKQAVPCVVEPAYDDIDSPTTLLALIDCNVRQRGGMGYLTITQKNNVAKTIEDCINTQRWWYIFKQEREDEHGGLGEIKYAERIQHVQENPPTIEQINRDLHSHEFKAVMLKNAEEAKKQKAEKAARIGLEVVSGASDRIDNNLTQCAQAHSDNYLTICTDGEVREETARMMNVTVNWLNRMRKLETLYPSLLDAVEDERIPMLVASTILASLSPVEQEAFLSTLPAAEKLTTKQVEERVAQIKADMTPQRVKDLEAELQAKESALVELQAQNEALEEAVESQLVNQELSSAARDPHILEALIPQFQQEVETAAINPNPYSFLKEDIASLMESLKALLSNFAAKERMNA